MLGASVVANWFKLRWVKYLGVGGLNTLVGYSIYAVFVLIGVPYLWALLMATIAGVIFNYFSFGRMVFKASGGWFVFGKFIAAYTVVYVVNAGLLSFLTERGNLNAYLAQALCIVPSVGIGWILMNYWVYGSK